MEFAFSQLKTALIGHFGIHPEKHGTFGARLKQLQRLGFPPGVNVGRGTKVGYRTTELFQLVTAFELINAGLPAAHATTIVTENWREFAAGYSAVVAPQLAINERAIVYTRVIVSALADLQKDPADYDARVFVHDVRSLAGILAPNDNRRSFNYVVLCTKDIVASLTRSAVKLARLPEWSLIEDMQQWYLSPTDNRGWMFLPTPDAWLDLTDANPGFE